MDIIILFLCMYVVDFRVS